MRLSIDEASGEDGLVRTTMRRPETKTHRELKRFALNTVTLAAFSVRRSAIVTSRGGERHMARCVPYALQYKT